MRGFANVFCKIGFFNFSITVVNQQVPCFELRSGKNTLHATRNFIVISSGTIYKNNIPNRILYEIGQSHLQFVILT